MGLSDYEKTLVKVLSEHPGINTRKFIQLAGLGKVTFYRNIKILEASGFIEYRMVKNRKIWYLVRRDKRHDLGISDSESFDLDKKYFRINSTVMDSLRKIRKGKITNKIDVYGDIVILIASNIASMNLLAIYRHNRIPSSYARFTKKLELLLEKISNARFFSDYGFGKTALDVVAFRAESRLDEFLGTKRNRKEYIY